MKSLLSIKAIGCLLALACFNLTGCLEVDVHGHDHDHDYDHRDYDHHDDHHDDHH